MKMIETACQFLRGFVLLWLFGAAMAQATESVTYFHLDAAGSPVAATNSGGSLLWQERYYPYGERLKTDAAAAASANRIWYTQHVEDNDAGLVYFGARWYNPQIGRFMSMDPVGVDLNNVNSFNRYAYANNNPYKYTDPDGRFPFLIPLIWGANAAWTAYNTYSTYQSEGAGAAAQSFVIDAGIGLATGGAATIYRGARAAGRVIEEGASVAKGVAADAKFAQKTYGATFSAEGRFAGQSVDDVAAALRSGAMKPGDIPINYIVRDGQSIILNTRSAQALEAAGIPRSQWNGLNKTGDSLFEGLLNGQLGRNTGGPFDAVRRTGTP